MPCALFLKCTRTCTRHFKTPHKTYIFGKMVKCPIPVSSFFYCNQQSCDKNLQSRMVADFLCAFCRLYRLSFRLKNLEFRQRNAHAYAHAIFSQDFQLLQTYHHAAILPHHIVYRFVYSFTILCIVL